MTRGDYTVQEVEASKQAGRDSSYRTCILTMFIFLALCIILLVIAWTTWRPMSEKEAYPHHSKYGDRQHTPNLNTEFPVTESEELTTKKHRKATYHPIRRTELFETQTTETSAATKRNLIRLVALETIPTINTEKARHTKQTTTEKLLTIQENYTNTITTTEGSLKQQIVLMSPTATTQKPLTQSEGYATKSTTIESPLTQLVDHSTVSTTPVSKEHTSVKTEQPLRTTIGETYIQVEETPDEKSAQVAITSTQQVEYTISHGEKQQQSTITDMPLHWHLTMKTPTSTSKLPQTQNLEFKTTPSLVQSEPETESTNEEYEPTQQELIHEQLSTQSTDLVTNFTLDAGTGSSVAGSTDTPFAESVTPTISGKDISDHSNPKITTSRQLTSNSESSEAEIENFVTNNHTTLATAFTGSSPATLSALINNVSASTASIIDRSTTTNATTDTTDNKSTTLTNLLTSSSSPSPHIQPVFALINTSASTHSSTTTPTIIIFTTDRDITKSSVSLTDDLLLSHSSSTIQFTKISNISITTDEPSHTNVTGEITAANANTTATSGVTLSIMSTQHSPTASGGTSLPTPSDKNQKITVNATVASEKKAYCTSNACKVLASRMLSLMNHSADPCEDFYEFACGGLRDNRNLLQHDPEYEVWTRIASAVKQINAHSSNAFQKFNKFYDQCLMYDSIVNKTSRLEEVRKVLESIGKMYNYTEWSARNLNLNLTSLLVKLFQLNSAPLFDVLLDVDVHNPSRFLLKLTAPSHQSKFQSESSFASHCKTRIIPKDKRNVNLENIYHKKYLACTRDYGEYMNITEKALKELGMFRKLEPFHEAQYIKDLRFFIEFEILHHLTELPTAGEMRHILLSKQFMSVSVDDLQTKYPLVDWKTLLSALVGDTVSPDTTVQLYFDKYFDSLFNKLSDHFKTDNKHRMNMHNALLAMFAHDLYVDLVETQSPCNREDYCLKVASSLLEDVSSALYLSTFTREQLNAMDLELQTLFTQLKFTLQEQFQEAEWLDDSSRSYLTSKLQQLIPITDGGRIFFGDSYMLNQRLSELDMNSSNSYLHNAVQLVRRYRSGLYSLYSTETNLTDTIWSHFLLPYDTQAIAVYQLNIVVIPFGLIGSPQSTPDLPDYIFKARVGNDLARQIAHHFDVTGIEYGPDGKDMNLLSGGTKSKYDTIKECDEMVYSFGKSWTNHRHQIFTYKVDASQSMNERFADSSALLLSYKTFKRNAGSEPLLPWLDMSHDKIYHMLVAQEFCTKGSMLDYTIQLFESEQMPPFLRVANLAQNSEEFSQAYSCGRGTQMNPEFKCSPFPELKEVDGYGSDLFPH